MFLEVPQEKFNTESYGEICQRKYYYTCKIKQMASYALRSKSKVYEIPFVFKMEIDEEILKKLPENEQRFYSDVCSGKFSPKFMKCSEREKEIENLSNDDIYNMHF